MIIEDFRDLQDVIDIIRSNDNMVSDVTNNPQYVITKKNGYKIFVVTIEPDDTYFSPDDYHGDRIYTILSNKLKDLKSVTIPIFIVDTDKMSMNWFIENYKENDFTAFIGNGYANIIINNGMYSLMDDGIIPCMKFLIISDGMYNNRSNALLKLISITE